MEQIAQIALSNHLRDDDSPDPFSPPAPHPSNSNNNNNKRKATADDTTTHPQPRAKRNRYISIACNECKRRKIKCNGQTPCQRCGNLNLECVYAPNCCNGFKESHEYREMTAQIGALQDQVHGLYHDLSSLRAQLGAGNVVQQGGNIDPSLQSGFTPHRQSFVGAQASPGAAMASVSPSMGRPKGQSQNSQPSFRGPTSSDFNFGVARNSLQTMGITSQSDSAVAGDSGDAGSATREPSPDPSAPAPRDKFQVLRRMHASKDPIWAVTEDEALRLCRVWEDEMGMMYPILNIDKVIAYAQRLFRFTEAAHRSGLMQQGFPGADAIDDDDTNILKMVMATAMTVEASGRSELGERIFEYVHPAIDNLVLGTVGVKGIRLLVLTAMYEFHRDNESASWRIIGMTARLCIELGLHRRETYDAMTDETSRSETILLFWAIYVLDRRWSFGTGMPFALQDADIDAQMPKPEDRSPYLSAMIQYSAIGAKVWRSVASGTSTTGPINTEDMGYLDYQIISWHRNIPPQLRYEHPSRATTTTTSVRPTTPAPSRAASRLKVILYIRANQMRILIYRPVLHSATSIIAHRSQAQTVVDVAKDTIRVLTHINQTSDLYRTQQVLFNAFLTSALAVLFLAVAHTPAEFAGDVREEFYMALELVRGFSKGSWISKKLWKTIRVLKDVGPKLGLFSSSSSSNGGNPAETDVTVPRRANVDAEAVKRELDSNRSAAVAMAGLAGHNVDESALYTPHPPHPPNANANNRPTDLPWPLPTGASSSPENMANDLTSLFEAAGGYQGAAFGEAEVQGLEGVAESLWEGEDGMAGIMRELF